MLHLWFRDSGAGAGTAVLVALGTAGDQQHGDFGAWTF